MPKRETQKHERRYTPKFFRQWQGEGVPADADYLEQRKSHLISTPVFCEIMANRLTELSHHHCGKTMVPDIVGGLIDTPIDAVEITIRIFYRRLYAKNFGFTLSEFPVARPGEWEGEAEDETDRTPMQMLWRKRRSYGDEKSSVKFTTASEEAVYKSHSRYDRKTDRGAGFDDTENVAFLDVSYEWKSLADPSEKISMRWFTDSDGNYFFERTAPTYNEQTEEYETETETFTRDDAPRSVTRPFHGGRSHFWDWNPLDDLIRSHIVTPDTDLYGESWDETAPTLTRDISRNQSINVSGTGEAAQVEILQTIALRWGLSEKYTTESLYLAMEKQRDKAPEEMGVQKSSINTFIAGFIGTHWQMPEALSEMQFISSRFAPVLDAKYDDGSFVVERLGSWVGCVDSWRERTRFDPLRGYGKQTKQVYKWEYDGNALPDDEIEPFQNAYPNGLGIMNLADHLFGAIRKLTEGNK